MSTEMKTLTIGGNTYEIVDEKARNSIPTKTSELENDSGFVSEQLQVFEGELYSNAFIHANAYSAGTIVIEADLPVGARAKRVLIPDLIASEGSATDSLINIEDMITAAGQNGKPYYIMYPKNMTGYFSVGVNAAIVVFPGDTNTFYDYVVSSMFSEGQIKVYYTIEED